MAARVQLDMQMNVKRLQRLRTETAAQERKALQQLRAATQACRLDYADVYARSAVTLRETGLRYLRLEQRIQSHINATALASTTYASMQHVKQLSKVMAKALSPANMDDMTAALDTFESQLDGVAVLDATADAGGAGLTSVAGTTCATDEVARLKAQVQLELGLNFGDQAAPDGPQYVPPIKPATKDDLTQRLEKLRG